MAIGRLFLTGIFAAAPLCRHCAAATELNGFWSDGCTLFPNGTLQDRTLWCDCCFNHDIAYWRGGSEQERKAADQALRACVLARTRNRALAETMFSGVRLGGSPAFPTWYRWGYGWNYGRGYQPLSRDEQKQVADTLARYKNAHPDGYCPKPGSQAGTDVPQGAARPAPPAAQPPGHRVSPLASLISAPQPARTLC